MDLKPTRKIDKDVLLRAKSRPCCICGAGKCDPSHVLTRGAGRPDTSWNVVSHCRRHHGEWGNLGPRRFFLKYPVMLVLLRSLGWEWDGSKLWHPGLAPAE